MLKAIILAAGKGTRMKSEKPKVVHEVLGKPMVYYSIEAARAAGCDKVCVIVGYKAEEVEKSIKDTYAKLDKTEEMQDVVSYALQTEQLVTGKTLEQAIKKHVAAGNGVTVISAMLSDPFGYGRIIRDEKGLSKIVEQKDATEEEQAVKEVNSGMYIFKCDALLAALSQITNDNAQGEYYLPDTIEIIKKMGLPVDAAAMEDADQIKGVNTLEQLAEAEEIMRSR